MTDMTERQTIIEILCATRGESEGHTADAILKALPQRVPEGWSILRVDEKRIKLCWDGGGIVVTSDWNNGPAAGVACYELAAAMLTTAPAQSADSDKDAEIARLRDRVEGLESVLTQATGYTRHPDYDWDSNFIKRADTLLDAARLRDGGDV
jgi:hypothetical protein